jgi:hypothetical protein
VINYFDLKKIENLSPLHIYSCRLDFGDLKKRYIKIIDLEGNKQNKATNIKAEMTSWRLNDKYGELQPLSEVFSEIYKKILETYYSQHYQIITHHYGKNYRFTDIDIWGARYRSREKTIPHDHLPAKMSYCLYLKTPKGCPGLSFTDISKTIPVQEDQLIIFDGSVRHSVKSKKFRGSRYILAANLYISNE